MRKVVLVPDSFKGTMSSRRIIEIMRDAVLRHYPGCTVVSIPVADGGEGTVDAFLTAVGGERIPLEVQGPWGDLIESFYGMLPDGTAVIEMSAAAGLPLAGNRLDPSRTSTFGVGELIVHAARRGAKRIVLGLGGSATNDAGCGAAAACGVRFLDSDGRSFIPVGDTLEKVAHIDISGLDSCVKDAEIIAMCDVDNPFHGTSGAAYVYGPQKGADGAMVKRLDCALVHLASLVRTELGVDLQSIPGSGAAGGMGGGMLAFLGAHLHSGIETVLDVTGFDSVARDADMVFTGEGRLDDQSLRGKVVVGVAHRAKRLGIPVIAIVGDIGDDIACIYDEGVSGIFSINRVAVPYEEAKARAEKDLALTMDNLMRFIDTLT